MRFFVHAIAGVFFASVLGCGDPDVHVNGLEVSPETAKRGSSLRVEGSIDSLATLTDVLISVHDEDDADLPDSAGITVEQNGLEGEPISWDLRDDGDVRIVTSKSTPPGRYKLRVEGKTDAKNAIDVKFFSVE